MRSDLPGARDSRGLGPVWAAGLLLVYVALHVGVRLLLPESLELDESEQLILTQAWKWSYGVANPPVYTWVQRAVFEMTGPGILGLALVKQLFLFLIFWFVYQAQLEIRGRSSEALLALCSVFFIPQFMWEAYRDLTHSVAVSACAAATLRLILVLRRRPSAWSYIGLGVAAGLGLLCKINYAILLGAALSACLVIPSFRPVLRDARIVLALLALLAVAGYPMAVTLQQSWDANAVARLGHTSVGKGLAAVVWASLAFCLPGIFIYWLASWPVWPWRKQISDEGRWLGWVIVIGLLGCSAGALFKGMYLKDRLLMPLLIGLPLWLVECMGRDLSPRRTRAIEAVAMIVAIGVLAALPASSWLSSKMKDPNRRSAPFARLARQLQERVGTPAVILAEDRWLGGNLRLAFPQSVVEVPEKRMNLPTLEGRWVVVWNLKKRQEPGAALAALAQELSGRSWDWEEVNELSAPYQYTDHQLMRLGVVVGPPPPVMEKGEGPRP